MSQSQFISWVETIPTDDKFTASLRSDIITGIKAYAAKNGELAGEDWFDADEDDIKTMCGLPDKITAKKFLRKIGQKKQKDADDKRKEKGIPQPGAAQNNAYNNSSFDLNIQAVAGKSYKISNVTGNTTVATVKSRFYDELGDKAGKDLYKGNLAKWRGDTGSTEKKIELKKNGKNMEDHKKLADYGITNGCHLPLVVSFKVRGGAESKYEAKEEDEDYRPRKLRKKKHKGYLTLTSKPDCIMGYTDSDGIPRAEMPCGCAFASDTMYRFSKSIFENSLTEAKAICPMPKGTYCKGNDKQRLWPWALVFAIADLSDKEISYYTNAIQNRISGSKNCPHCGAVTERPDDLRISRVRCNVCCKSDWCWNCSKVWAHGGLGPICGNDNCMGAEIIKILKNCGEVAAPWSDINNKGKMIPKTRACPKCNSPLEYVEACKHIWCICCPHQFCFNCLGEWNKVCSHNQSCDYKEQKI